MGVLRPKVPCSLRVVGNDAEDGDDVDAVVEKEEEYLSDCSASSGRSLQPPPPPPHPHPHPPGRRRRRRPRCNVAEEDSPRRPRVRRDRYVEKAIGSVGVGGYGTIAFGIHYSTEHTAYSARSGTTKKLAL